MKSPHSKKVKIFLRIRVVSMQNPKWTGKCLCGAITYLVKNDPLMSGCCHCDDCQRQTGSSFAPLLIFNKNDFSSIGNTLVEFKGTGGSGKSVKRGFCSICGTSVFSWYEVTPDFLVVMAGTLDNKLKFLPEWDIYSDQAQHWIKFPKEHKVFRSGYGSD